MKRWCSPFLNINLSFPRPATSTKGVDLAEVQRGGTKKLCRARKCKPERKQRGGSVCARRWLIGLHSLHPHTPVVYVQFLFLSMLLLFFFFFFWLCKREVAALIRLVLFENGSISTMLHACQRTAVWAVFKGGRETYFQACNLSLRAIHLTFFKTDVKNT